MPAQTRILDFSGLQKLLTKLSALGAKAETIAGAALYQEAEAIMTKSKKRTPVDTGNLRASGSVQRPELSGGRMTVVLGYGGPVGVGNQGGETNKEAVNYAIVQHEDMSLDHSKILSKKESKRRGGVVWGEIGGPKYLEVPMLEAVNGMEARLGAKIQKGIEDAAK